MNETYTKRFLCLANSRKPPSGRCIAGRELRPDGTPGAWIRPVSARDTREISEEERRFDNGDDPTLMDIIEVAFQRHLPHLHQQENHLIDDNFYWRKVGSITPAELDQWVEGAPRTLWLNGSSSYNGENDRVREEELATLTRSLYLLRPDDLRISVGPEGLEDPRLKVRAHFTLAGVEYRLMVTDPGYERRFLAQGRGQYPVADAAICVSLSEPFHGYAYKLVAAVLPP